MTAYERLHAALSGSPEVRPGQTYRLIADRDAEQLRATVAEVRGMPADHLLDPGRADVIGLLCAIADAFEKGKDTNGSSTIPAAVGESTQACTVSGCGSLGRYLDTTIQARATWTQIRTGAGSDDASRWYHSAHCAATALTQAAPAPPSYATGPLQCARCGCTEDDACVGGCHWQPTMRMQDLCSACVNPDGSCTTPGCGTPAEGLDVNDPTIVGWLLLRVAGADSPGRWVCSPWCLGDVLDEAAAELVLADSAATLDDTGLTMTGCACQPDAKWPCGHCRHDECQDCHRCAGPGCAGTSRACTCTTVKAVTV